MLVNKLKYHRFIIGFLTCVLTGLISNLSLAFTLGDIRLNSALNEPLSANIELLELDGLDESQILVALGSEADFDRVGVEPLPLLNELEFEVEVLSNSEGLVRITSADAIVEPYLNFVLNVRWPSGWVIREYTVLLDLPTFSANPTPAPAPTPARTTPAPPPQVEPVPQQVVEVPEPTPVAPAPEIDETPDTEPSSETVVIQSGDSLWNIALATRPGNDVSVQQMMLAIQRANTNSDAFIGNNINGIRAGRVLRIPSRQEINAINQEQAVTQVAVQNQQFSNSAQPLAVNNSQGSSNNSRDELSIVNNADDEAENEEIADLNATIAILENELAFSEENLDRALLENAELNSRLNDLEEEIAILENIIAIEGQRMAELQEALADQDNAATSDVLAVVPPQNPAPAPASTSPEPAPAPAPGIIGQVSNLLSSTLGMIAALLVLLALVVGFLIARNRSASKEEDDFDSILAEEETGFSANAAEDAGMEESLFAEEVADVIAEDTDEQESFGQAEITESEENMQLDDSEQDIQQELADEEDVFADNDEKESGKAGFLAGLLAKFSRKKDTVSEEEDFFDEDDEIDEDSDSAEELGNLEENNETTSSLGNLGLDDAVAFDESDEDELEVITDQDEVSTKLDLAVAYQAMDDMDGAKEILDEVIAEGNEAQIAEAKKLLNEWGGS